MAKKDKNGKKDQQPEQFCDVCKFKIMDTQVFEKLQCFGCGSIVHKLCYAPDFKENKNNKFKCDSCKKRSLKSKSKEDPTQCSFCGIQKGVLKEISNGQSMHVLCALTCPRVTLIDYQSLRFTSESTASSKKPTKQKCSKCKLNTFAQPCIVKQCKQRAHLNCIVNELAEIGKQSTEVCVNKLGLLDRNEGSLIFRLQKQQSSFQGLTLVENEGREPQYFVCKSHNNSSDFIWCLCGREQTGDQVQCQFCERWYHNVCESLYMSEVENKKICIGCKENNIYVKNMSLPEIISEAIKVQTRQHWDKTNVKFLDHFAVKYSIQIEKKLKDQRNRLTIQRYFLRKELSNFKKQGNNQQQEGRILQILYCLFKKQVKDESQITIEDVQQILADKTYSSDKLNLKWAQERPQESWKNFLQLKLKKLKKDDWRSIKRDLMNIEKQLSNKKNQRQIASSLFPVLKMLSNTQMVKTVLLNMHSSTLDNLKFQILKMLVDLQASKSQLEQILRSFKILLAARTNKHIDQNDYYSKKLRVYPIIRKENFKDFQNLHLKLLQGVFLRLLHHKRRQILWNLQDKKSQAQYSERKVLRNKAISNGVLIPNSFQVFKDETEIIEFQIQKKILLRKLNTFSFQELSSIVNKLHNILTVNQRLELLEDQQRKSLQILKQKYKLFSLIFKCISQQRKKIADSNRQKGILQQAFSQSQNKQIQDLTPQQKIQKELSSILNEWPMDPTSIVAGLKYLYQAVIKQVSFPQNQQQIIRAFFNKLVSNLNKMIKPGTLLKLLIVQQVVTLTKYFKLQNKPEYFFKVHNFYEQWKQKLEKNCHDIENVLECPQRTKIFLSIIDQTLASAALPSTYLDLSTEIRKLKIMRAWALFSQKMLGPQKEATITAIQNARSLMNKISYPKNKVRDEIQKLDLQSTALNQKIGRFLQRQKFTDMPFHEELRLVQTKMTLKQGFELQRDLQNSQLYVQIQLIELTQQLNKSKFFPTNFAKFCQQSKDSQTLAELRKKVIEGPFLVCQLKDYQTLLRAYYSRKCQQFSGTTTKKQYLRMIQYGGFSAHLLFNKTQDLYKIYKDIQIAQNQIMTARPRPQLLLNYDIRRLKALLQQDPAEFARLQKYYIQGKKFRQRLHLYKEERADISKYNVFQSELLRIPLNLKDLSVEIIRMKKELQLFTTKVNAYLLDQNQVIRLQFCSPFNTQLVSKYQRCGMTNAIMNKFEMIITQARQITELSSNLSFANYKIFSLACDACDQLSKNDQIFTKRKSAFLQIYQHYIQSPQPLIEVGLTLLKQGGVLIKRPKVTQQVLLMLVNIKDKFMKSEKRISIQDVKNRLWAEYIGEQDMQEDYDQDQYSEDYDEESQDIEDQEDGQNNNQNAEIGSKNSDRGVPLESQQREFRSIQNKVNKKRRRPNQYVISDGEDEE